MKKLIVLLVAIATLSLFPSTPSHASHDNDFGHWNQPPLVVSQASAGFDSLIQDAFYYWQDIAFFRGYYPPLPAHGGAGGIPPGNCGLYEARINICVVNPGDPRLQGGKGYTFNVFYGDGSTHVRASEIYIDASLTGASLQNVMRHEAGHALGLGHYNKFGSGHPSICTVMNEIPCGPYASSTDAAGIYTWQPWYHYH